MTIQEAIKSRHSVRQYKFKPIEKEKVQQLQDLISECNREGDLNIQLVTDEPEAFNGGLAKYGKFSGVSNYIAVIGKKGDAEKLGFYGEKIVIFAQMLGLNTCWVGLTFKKQKNVYTLREGENLHCVISVGYGENQGVSHPQKKGVENYVTNREISSLPDWFRRGMEAALLAPTAVNQQKFEFTFVPDNKVSAKTTFSLVSSYTKLDLGIVKYHFEVAAGKENFEWLD